MPHKVTYTENYQQPRSSTEVLILLKVAHCFAFHLLCGSALALSTTSFPAIAGSCFQQTRSHKPTVHYLPGIKRQTDKVSDWLAEKENLTERMIILSSHGHQGREIKSIIYCSGVTLITRIETQPKVNANVNMSHWDDNVVSLCLFLSSSKWPKID